MTDVNSRKSRAIEYISSSESEIEEPFVSEHLAAVLEQEKEPPVSESLLEGLSAMEDLLSHSLNQKTLAEYKVCS